MSDCTFNPVKAFLAYSRSVEVAGLLRGCNVWYPYISATGQVKTVLLRSVRDQKRAWYGSFITRTVGEVPIRFGKSQFLTLSEARRDGEAASV